MSNLYQKIHYHFRHLLHDKLCFLGLIDEKDVIKEMELREYSADKTIELLNYL